METGAYPDAYVSGQFEMWWPRLETALNSAPTAKDLKPSASQAQVSKHPTAPQAQAPQEMPVPAADISEVIQQALNNALTSPDLINALRDGLAVLSDADTAVVRQLIRNALSNPQWNWRTPAAIAKESGVSDGQALRILRQMAVEGEVRFSPSDEFGIVVGLTART